MEDQYHWRHSTKWNIREFLLKNDPKLHHKINEKDLLKGLQNHAGEGYCVPRGLAQHLKGILMKEKMVKNILERPKHAVFLDKVRNCAPTFSPTTLTASTPPTEAPTEAPTHALTASKPPQIKRKTTEALSSSGKRYRMARLADVMDQGELKLISESFASKDKVESSKALNYVHDAHMSNRDMSKTIKLVKEHTGQQVLPGKHLLLKAKKSTYPPGNVADEFKAEILLQQALDKTIKRILGSKLISDETKVEIGITKNVTFIVKAGSDGTSGFNKQTSALREGPLNKM